MNEQTWQSEYMQWKLDLKPYELKLLEEGGESLSQAWLLNAMWCEWKEIKKLKATDLPHLDPKSEIDPWL